MTNARCDRWWQWVFCGFGALSLSSMAGMSIGGALFLLVSCWVLIVAGGPEGRSELARAFRHPLGWASLALFLSAGLSLAYAWLFPPEGIPVSGFRELKKFHHFLYPPFVALAFLRLGGSVERNPFWKWWGGMGIFCGLLACAQFFGSDLFPSAWLGHRFFRAIGETGRFHGQGLMFFHLSFASCLSFVASAGMARLLWPVPGDGARDRRFWACVAVAGVAAVIFSYSRIAFLGLGLAMVALAFLRRPSLGVVTLLICGVVAFSAWTFSPSFRGRFKDNEFGNRERVLMWESAWQMFRDRPLLGFGFARSGKYTPIYAERILGERAAFTSHAHNNALDSLAATGLLGLFSYFAWWGVLFVSAWRSFRADPTRRWLPAAALAAFLAFQANGLTQVNFWDGKSQHTLMIWAGVVLALALRRRAA